MPLHDRNLNHHEIAHISTITLTIKPIRAYNWFPPHEPILEYKSIISKKKNQNSIDDILISEICENICDQMKEIVSVAEDIRDVIDTSDHMIETIETFEDMRCIIECQDDGTEVIDVVEGLINGIDQENFQ